MDAPADQQNSESPIQATIPTGDNVRRSRRPRLNRDSDLMEAVEADFQTTGSMRENRGTISHRGSAYMHRSDANSRTSGRRREPGFRHESGRQDPGVLPQTAQVRASAPQEGLCDDTHSEAHTSRNLSQEPDRVDSLRLDSFPTNRQQRRVEGFPSQDVRIYGHVDFPSQDVRRREQFANSALPSGERRRMANDRRHLRRGFVVTVANARDQNRRRRGEQQPGEGVNERQRPFAENMSDQVEASREAAAEALQGLSVNGNPGRDRTDSLRGNTRNIGRWRRRSDSDGAPFKSTTESSRESGSRMGGTAKESTMNVKSSVPMLVQELVEKIVTGKVECMICYDTVNRNAAIWSCGSCYSIFHVSCIRKWARAPSSVDMSVPMPRDAPGSNWRCPGCQAVQLLGADELKYWCFCGQMVDPPLDLYITPHSCGGPCRKPLNKGKYSTCKHVCTMQCHPGPCPPCTAIAPPQTCPCGKTSYVRRCSEQKPSNSCGQRCGHQFTCGKHYCDKLCHEGSCGECDVLLTAKCFCGQKEDLVRCDWSSTFESDILDAGVFSCGGTCLKLLECRQHRCMKSCHPGECGDCDLAPRRLNTCPCGKKTLQELLGCSKQRNSCCDPVPLCGQRCEKLLPCGMHLCQSSCHTGSCSPCTVLVEQKCRCGSSTRTAPCYKTASSGMNTVKRELEGDEDSEKPFLCNRKCGRKRNCGRHRCNSLCCPLANNGSLLLGPENNPHFCLLACGKKLRCGQHTCQETCHNGYCPPCLESIFTELSCVCGRTSIPPPVPCGTPPPSCQFPCVLPQPCGHSATHTCHFGECPPCIVPSDKECVGNHVTLRNIPCGSRDIKCNKPCGKTRQCGLHTCSRTCHLPPCDTPCISDDSGTNRSCGQPCGAPRRDCQHTCIAPCHPSAPCPDTRCKFPVKIACACGRLSAEVPCDAGDLGRGDAIAEAASIAKLPAPLQPVDGRVRVPLGQRKLACDDECARLEKKKILADAFGINMSTESPLAIGGGIVCSEAVTEIARKEPQWVMSVEDRFKYLVLGTKAPTSGPIRVHVFCSLPKERRDVIRQLAERWNLSVNLAGREPRRFVTVNVTTKTKVPVRSLIGRAPLPIAGQAHSPPFNAAMDMDPRLVVGLFDLPREADISTLILRFGGECELVWLNDKNALAIFSDAARANTAMRRVECASSYHGAVSLPQLSLLSGTSSRGWGANESVTSARGNLRHKNVQESSWVEDAWGDESVKTSQQLKPVRQTNEAGITATSNPWGALELDTKPDAVNGSLGPSILASSVTDMNSTSASKIRGNDINKRMGCSHVSDAADDWEKTFS